MNAWAPLIFFEGEDENALKGEFVRLSAKHQGKYSAYEVAQFVFRDLKEPQVRAAQAAQYWGKDLEVTEAIDKLIVRGPETQQTSVDELRRIAMQIAEDTRIGARERVAALYFVAETQGNIVKAVDKKVTLNGGSGGLPQFIVRLDPDADKQAAQ